MFRRLINIRPRGVQRLITNNYNLRLNPMFIPTNSLRLGTSLQILLNMNNARDLRTVLLYGIPSLRNRYLLTTKEAITTTTTANYRRKYNTRYYRYLCRLSTESLRFHSPPGSLFHDIVFM